MENKYDSAYAGETASVGMKRYHEPSEGKLDAAVMEKRYRHDDDSGNSENPVYAPSAGTKRGYEQPEDDMEDDMEAESVDKRYKGNYWEDPACAWALQLRGGRKAKHAAQMNRCYRVIKEVDAWLASVAVAARKS